MIKAIVKLVSIDDVKDFHGNFIPLRKGHYDFDTGSTCQAGVFGCPKGTGTEQYGR